MENYDKAKAARVWQRVQGAATANPTQGLPGMIAEEWGNGPVFCIRRARPAGADKAGVSSRRRNFPDGCSSSWGAHTPAGW